MAGKPKEALMYYQHQANYRERKREVEWKKKRVKRTKNITRQ